MAWRWGWKSEHTRVQMISDPKDFKNSPRNFKTLKGFQRKKEDAIDSLMTGFTYGSQKNHGNVLVEETSSIYPPAVNLNGYAEPSLITGLAFAIWC